MALVGSRPRVLFLGEAVTLAHVARTVVLAEALQPDHEVAIGLAASAHRFAQAGRFDLLPLESIPGAQFTEALRKGRPLYDETTLARYVEADLALIERFRPDLVVGDFRISLSVSARLRRVPYLTIANAYWSPWHPRPAPLPVLPWTGFVPLPLAQGVFAMARDLAMAAHTIPMRRLCARHGLPSPGRDLRRVYTDADAVAYADVPELFPTPGAPGTHRHIGPILWSPPGDAPGWWTAPIDGPSAYVTMGSSGDPALLGSIVAALDALGITALVATAGGRFTPPAGSRARVSDYLPGMDAARRTDLVICNGGSMTVQQALAAGKPVIGIASNMDQFFNMGAIADAGAGLTLRADRVSVRRLDEAIRRVSREPTFASEARRLSGILARYSAPQRFRSMVAGILGAASAGDARHEKDPAQPDPDVHPAVQPGLRAGVGNEPPRA